MPAAVTANTERKVEVRRDAAISKRYDMINAEPAPENLLAGAVVRTPAKSTACGSQSNQAGRK